MQTVNFELDYGSGYAVSDPPKNWKAMKLQLIFDKEAMQQQLQSILFEWPSKNAKLLNNYRKAGLTGGTGLLEGIGCRIKAGDLSDQIFDGCLNTADGGCDWQDDLVKIPIKESGKKDWFESVAPSLPFSLLYESYYSGPGKILRSDFKLVPYTRSHAPDDNSQILSLNIQAFIMVKEAYSVIDNIIQKIKEIAAATFFWSIILCIIGLILYILYLCMLIIECIKLTQQMIELILPPKKYKLAMREADLFIKGCAYFGLTYVSSIHGEGVPAGYNGKWINATWVPEKIMQNKPLVDPITDLFRTDDEVTNALSYGYFDGTFKDFYEVMCKRYNAKGVIQNGKFYFEEKDNFNVANPYVLPNEGAAGNTFLYPQPYSVNASEINSVYIIRYSKDEQDLNTINDYTGTYCLANTQAITVHRSENKLLSGQISVDLPCAHARRKEYMTKVEKALIESINRFAHLYTAVFGQINYVHDWLQGNSFLGTPLSSVTSSSQANTAISDFLATMATSGFAVSIFIVDAIGQLVPNPNFDYGQSRIGWMMLSSPYTSVPKSFIGVNWNGDWQISPTNSTDNAAVSLMADFHAQNLGVNNFDGTKNNQWLIFKNKKIRFGMKEWNQVLNSNILVTADGKKGKFERIVWDIHNDQAEVDYRIREDWTHNLTCKISQDNG